MKNFIRVKINKILIWIFKGKIREAEKKKRQYQKEGNIVICYAYDNLIKTYENTIIYLSVEK